jgi:hypothetical protein
VDFATTDGTALAGEHYTSTAGTLVFEEGMTSKVILVPVHHNESEARRLTVTLADPMGGARLGLRRTIVNIPAAQ